MKPWYQETFDPLVRLNRKGQPREEKDSYTFKDMADCSGSSSFVR